MPQTLWLSIYLEVIFWACYLVGVSCGQLDAPSNGRVDTSAGTSFGDVARYSCDAGYALNGAAERTCQSDGRWNGTEPTCEGETLWQTCAVINWCNDTNSALYRQSSFYCLFSILFQPLSKWRDLHSSWHLHLWCWLDRNAVWNKWVTDWVFDNCYSWSFACLSFEKEQFITASGTQCPCWFLDTPYPPPHIPWPIFGIMGLVTLRHLSC